jgi:hypothetical protein
LWAEFGAGGVQRFLVAIKQHDPRAFGQKYPGTFEADARSRSGNGGDLAG